MPTSKISLPTGHSSTDKSARHKDDKKKNEKKGHSHKTADGYTTIALTIYIFRGAPDQYRNRHVLVYFRSPDLADFFETVHVQRDTITGLWSVDQIHIEHKWELSNTYISHVNAGAVVVPTGQEMLPVEIMASTSVDGKEDDDDWNCQDFLLDGLQALVGYGLQVQEWYDAVESDLLDKLLEECRY